MQRGQTLLVLLLLLSFGAVLLVYGSTTEVGRVIKAENRTRSVLEQARQALIGRAVADANRPGSLPCPDTNDDGSADLFVGSSCPSYIGRLPWRTLGIGDLRDESGERLWYALSGNFRDHPSAPPLNSDTKGTLTVHHSNTATTATTQAIAVVFAPGVGVPGQVRDNVVAFCNSTGTTIPRNRCAANYLDTAAAVSNATVAGPYISAPVGELFNDKMTMIVAADVIPLVEQRVALEVRNALLAYRSASPCKCYPWADSGTDGVSDSGINRGRIPHTTALPSSWPIGTLPPYFSANGWGRVIYYAVAKTALHDSGTSCKTCVDPSLAVDGASGHDVVLITPGYAGAGRPSVSWSDYLDDTENRNNDDLFVTPASTAADRDRLYSIVGTAAGCARNAHVLIENLPCGAPGGVIRPVCQAAASTLSTCTCMAAAAVMMKSPCSDALNSPACHSALSSLQACVL
ncbi:MAG: hypothetical protein ACXWIH_16825 [Burkholderiales bacterium]